MLEYANSHKLQQDHPCVIEIIRRDFLRQPFPANVSYQLHNMEVPDPSAGQAKGIMRILQNQVEGRVYVDKIASCRVCVNRKWF